MIINSISANQFSAFKKQQYSKIYKHELAHKNAAGSLGGPIVIETDKNGVANAGHVDIKMPQLNEANPDETIKDAQTVVNAALAPEDPSSQDEKVASEANEILEEAQNQKTENSQAENNQTENNTQNASVPEWSGSSCANKLNFWA